MTGADRASALVAAAVLALPLAGVVTGAAQAFVPSAERIAAAVVETNVASGRTEALRLQLSLKIGDRPTVASGELVSHPTGLARLELRGTGDLVERHLLQGSELTVSRDGKLLEEHRTFLPPLFILQADSAATMRAALESFDVQPDIVGLAECDETDCFVLGDPTREVPRPEIPSPVEVEPEASELEASAETPDRERADDKLADGEAPSAVSQSDVPEAGEPQPDAEPRIWPKLWVDVESYEIRGIDFAAGVRVRLGPIAVFDKLRVPAWFLIEEPGKTPARFDVVGASLVNASASAFTSAWLFAPVFTEGDAAESSPEPNP